MQARRRRLRRLHQPEGLHRPGRGQPCVQRPRDRHRRQHRPAATRDWTVDTTGPSASISGGPADPTNSTDASLTFGSEAGASFECKLDAGAYAACTSPKDYTGLERGQPRLQRPRDRHRRQHRLGHDAQLDRRYEWPERVDHGRTGRPDSSTRRSADVQQRGRGNLPVQARQRRVRGLREPEGLHRTGRGCAHLQRARDRQRRQHRLGHDAQLDRRYEWPERVDHGRTGRPDLEHRRVAELHHRGRSGLGVQARCRLVRRLHQPEGLHRPERGQPRLQRPRDRQRRQHRLGHDAQLDRRYEWPERVDHGRTGRPDLEHRRVAELHHRGRRGLGVQARRRLATPPAPARRTTPA